MQLPISCTLLTHPVCFSPHTGGADPSPEQAPLRLRAQPQGRRRAHGAGVPGTPPTPTRPLLPSSPPFAHGLDQSHPFSNQPVPPLPQMYAQMRAMHFLKYNQTPPAALLKDCGSLCYAFSVTGGDPPKLPPPSKQYVPPPSPPLPSPPPPPSSPPPLSHPQDPYGGEPSFGRPGGPRGQGHPASSPRPPSAALRVRRDLLPRAKGVPLPQHRQLQRQGTHLPISHSHPPSSSLQASPRCAKSVPHSLPPFTLSPPFFLPLGGDHGLPRA